MDVQLKRQINGLDEAGIIRKDVGLDLNKADGNADAGKGSSDRSSNLDVGWLNSRSGKVGRDMEAELWAKARQFLEGMEKDEDCNENGPRPSMNEDEDMDD